MNIDELLGFQPEKPNINSKESVLEPALKKRKVDISEDEKTRLLEELEKNQSEELLDKASIRKMTTVLEKRIAKNQEMRIKFADNPDKFMQSEIELNDSIQEFSAVATNPDLYTALVEFRSIELLINLINHENTDIALTVVNVLQEITDVESENESCLRLVDEMIKLNCVPILIECLERLNELVKEDAYGIYDILGIIENLFDLNATIIEHTSIELKFIDWLLNRINNKNAVDGNKLYASEILCICLQESDKVKTYFANDLDGTDVVLHQLSYFKRQDPQTSEEIEYMENLFSCLCSTLLNQETHSSFLKAEGLQLMNLMIRERRLSRYGALKTLSFVLCGMNASACCQKYIEILGLRVIFPLLIKAPRENKKIGVTKDDNEERVISVIHALVINCSGASLQRLVLKFTEHNFEKIERLVELHIKYKEKVENQSSIVSNDGDLNELSAKLEWGLLSLQLLDVTIIKLCTLNSSGILDRIVQLCAVRGVNIFDFCTWAKQYANTLPEKDKFILLDLIDKFIDLIDDK